MPSGPGADWLLVLERLWWTLCSVDSVALTVCAPEDRCVRCWLGVRSNSCGVCVLLSGL